METPFILAFFNGTIAINIYVLCFLRTNIIIGQYTAHEFAAKMKQQMKCKLNTLNDIIFDSQ